MTRLLVPAVLVAVLFCLALRPGGEETARRRPVAPAPEPVPEAADVAAEPRPEVVSLPVNRVHRAEPDDPVTEDAGLGTIRFLLREQNADGSWGDGEVTFEGHRIGAVGLTALALDGFTSAGFTHLSRDEYEGRRTGAAVREAWEFLIRRMGADGRFGGVIDEALEQALAAYALSETYGYTGSNLLREPAGRGLDALWAMQLPDGSWGTRSRTDWAALALSSAKVCDLATEPATVERLAEHYRRREALGPDVGAAFFRSSVLREKSEELKATGVALAALPLPTDMDHFGPVYFRFWTLRALLPMSSPAWRSWHESYREAYGTGQSGRQVWSGGSRSHAALRNALASQDLGLYKAYHHPYSVK